MAVNFWISQDRLLLQSDEFEKVADVSTKILKECESHNDPNLLHQVQALLMLSRSEESMKKYDQAESAAKRAVFIIESDNRLKTDYHAFLAYEQLGSVYLKRGDLKEAKEFLLEADRLGSPTWTAQRWGDHRKRMEEVNRLLNKD